MTKRAIHTQGKEKDRGEANKQNTKISSNDERNKFLNQTDHALARCSSFPLTTNEGCTYTTDKLRDVFPEVHAIPLGMRAKLRCHHLGQSTEDMEKKTYSANIISRR